MDINQPRQCTLLFQGEVAKIDQSVVIATMQTSNAKSMRRLCAGRRFWCCWWWLGLYICECDIPDCPYAYKYAYTVICMRTLDWLLSERFGMPFEVDKPYEVADMNHPEMTKWYTNIAVV